MAVTSTPATLPAGFQAKLVELYSESRCDEIVRTTDPAKVMRLRPNIMAIVASCDPPWGDPEAIFRAAEAREPTGDLILVLHAKYRTRKDRPTAAPLWRKVLLTARNPAFVQMANDYFSGVLFDDKPINLSSTTFFAELMAGGALNSNPRPPEFVYLNYHGSGESLLSGNFTLRHWYRWGSVAADYSLDFNHFFSQSTFDLLDQRLEIPVALHISATKDLVFEPVAGYSRMESAQYDSYLYGIAVLGVVYKGTYRQSAKGLVYSEHIDNVQLSALSGAHYRFEYSWDFFPRRETIETLFWIEHVSAGHTGTFNGVTGYFPFSHTDIGGNFKFEHNLRAVTFAVAPRVSYRIDSEDSTFPIRPTGEQTAERRADWMVGIRPSATFPILPSVQVYAWYDYQRIFSSIGPEDYVDRNQVAHVGGLALKATLSSY